jgi:ABC-type antimicrobial peptide transport system permease subunit
MESGITESKKKQYLTKEMFLGLFTGFIATFLGVFICVFVISMLKDAGIIETFTLYSKSGNLWTVLTLGALANLAVFFWFLKLDKEYRARGVLLATFIVAIAAYIIYFK